MIFICFNELSIFADGLTRLKYLEGHSWPSLFCGSPKNGLESVGLHVKIHVKFKRQSLRNSKSIDLKNTFESRGRL